MYLKSYRSEIKERYPAYFNEFPFYAPLRVIGVITQQKVYIIFTKDGNPKKTSFEVLDETDIPELMRVKDAIFRKDEDIFALLGIKTLFWEMSVGRKLYTEREQGDARYFDEDNANRAATISIRFHYERLFDHQGDVIRVTSLGRGQYKPTVESKYRFVYNSIEEKSLKTKVEEILARAEEGEEILITGWIGSFAIRFLNALKKRNIKFRIITHKPSSPKKGKPASDEYDIFTKVLTKEFSDNVRILGKLHARLLLSEKEALVSTADFTKDSHEEKFEAGISTTDGLMILELKKFFEKMWESATRLSKK
jgi:hypothetical protein